MLVKLMKHELKATSRLLLPLYLILFFIAFINRFTLNLSSNDVFEGSRGFLSGFFLFTFIITIIIVIITTFVLMIMRFYQNLLTDEGYLMFTLPVKSHQLINAKLITTIFWILIDIISIIVSLLIVFATPQRMDILKAGLQSFINELNEVFQGNASLIFIQFILLLLVALILNILTIYVSIAVGQLFTGHKLVGSFIAYMAIYTTLQILMVIMALIFGIINYDNISTTDTLPTIFLPLFIGFALVVDVVFYTIANTILKKKLNLE